MTPPPSSRADRPGLAPHLSILVPTWNRLNDLKTLLERLLPLAARDPRVEVTVSNNGSTDGTKALLDALPPHPRLRIIHQPVNYGPHLHIAWLYGQARAPHLWLCADDDAFEEGLPGEILSCLDQRPELAWIHLPHQFVRPDGPPRLSRCPESLQYAARSRALFPDYMHWLTLISSNVISSSLLQPLLSRVTFESCYWPTLLLMDAVADRPGCVLPTRRISAGWNISWADQAREIGCVHLPAALLADECLTRAEKRACLREHYRLVPQALDGVARFRPGLLLRLLLLDPGLCDAAFLARITRKTAARLPRRAPQAAA